jgi:hypothetical protein
MLELKEQFLSICKVNKSTHIFLQLSELRSELCVTKVLKHHDLVHIMRPLLFFGEQAGDARHVEAHHSSHRHAAVALQFGEFEASTSGLDELLTTE